MKKILWITLLIFIPALLIGISTRGNYINKNDLSYYTVATMNAELMGMVTDNIERAETNCAYVLKVKCVSNTQFIFKNTYQDVEVLEVFKGDEGIEKDSVIKISPCSSCIFTDDNSINMGFINEMKVGDEYLVFLDEKKMSEDLDMSIYPTTDFVMTTIFAYKDIDNAVVDGLYVKYTTVENNEIFANSQRVIDKFLEMKEQLLERYCGSRRGGSVYSLSLKDISATGATLCISHNDEISYGRAYTIEVEKDGVWIEVAYVDDTVNVAFPDDKTYLTGAGEKEEVLDWTSIYGMLDEGHYRLVKEINVNDEKSQEYIEFKVSH